MQLPKRGPGQVREQSCLSRRGPIPSQTTSGGPRWAPGKCAGWGWACKGQICIAGVLGWAPVPRRVGAREGEGL